MLCQELFLVLYLCFFFSLDGVDLLVIFERSVLVDVFAILGAVCSDLKTLTFL